MASRLKWVKTVISEVFQDGRRYYIRSRNGGLKCFPQFTRSLEYNHGEACRRCNSARYTRRRADPVNNAHKHVQYGSKLREAVASLIARLDQETAISPYVYVDVLQGCFRLKDLESVKQVHECIKKSGLGDNPYVANNLLKCYIGCGRLSIAEELFNQLVNKTIVSWNVMIGGYAESDQAEGAVEVYNQFRYEGGQPNAITYLNVLKACASPVALTWGKCIHAHILRNGFQTDVRVGTALVSMYAKCGSIQDARAVFAGMERRNTITWNAMIGGLAQHGHGHEAFSFFHQMQREGFTPGFITYLCILGARGVPEDLAWVKQVHSHAKKSGLDHNLNVNNVLIQRYAKCGSIDDAKLVFDRMMNRDLISWTVMIGGLAQHGLGHEAFSLFLQLEKEGLIPDSITYVSILNPCSSEGALEWVKEVHAHATRAGLDVDLRVGNALVHMYAKTGSISDAREVFDKMLNRDVVTWTAMIGGLSQHGLGHEAFSLFLQMQREGFLPDSSTFVSILDPLLSNGAVEWLKEVHTHATKASLDVDLRVGSALVQMYAKIGSIADARHVFDKMPDRDVVSWTVMIGGLAQHGHGRVALQLFEEMKVKGVKPNGPLFVVVLSACSHAGLVDEGRSHLLSMTRDKDIKPVLEHFNCIVDILGRAGHLEEAKLVIFNTPIKPDKVTWMTFLSACKTFNHVSLGNLLLKNV